MQLHASKITNRSVPFILGLLACAGAANAQTDVRAWYAKGQVFVIWRADATDPLTYDVYRTGSAPGQFTNISQGQLVGRSLQPEWQGERLKIGSAAATWTVPTPQGGEYTLAANEGLFVFTPHEAGTQTFAVARNNGAAPLTSRPVNSSNRSVAVTIAFDPANDPVVCHSQYSWTTPEGHPFTVYAMWADGGRLADNTDTPRPDYPITASFNKNGSPHVFAVTEPVGGIARVAAPYPMMIALHGGGGQYTNWRPDAPNLSNVDTAFPDGLWVAHDDPVYFVRAGQAQPVNIFWFGYAPTVNPFVNLNAPLPSTAVVEVYSLKRLDWALDWLLERSPYATGVNRGINPRRISVTGHSMGAQGTLLHSRYRPERYSSATAFNPGLQGAGADGASTLLLGTVSQNLISSVIGPGGIALGVSAVFYPENRLSQTERDLAFSRIYLGRYDQSGNANWGVDKVERYTNINNAAWGMHLYWDQRNHPVQSWDNPTFIPGFGTAVAQWVLPPVSIGGGQTERAKSAYQTRYRSDQTFPAFFDDDQNPALSGSQPNIGNGDPNNGDPWATWSGYYDWDQETLVDLPERWAATVFLTGLSATPVDNARTESARVNIALRKTQNFNLEAGTDVRWSLRRVSDNSLVRSGRTQAAGGGLVVIRELLIARDPDRVRLEVSSAFNPGCPADYNNDGFLNSDDLSDFITDYFSATRGPGRFSVPCGDPEAVNGYRADYNGDCTLNSDDLSDYITTYFNGCDS